MSEEKAVDVGQLSQPAQTNFPQADTVGYFEPQQPADLAKHGRLYVVADGVEGAASGQIAGQYAVKKILHSFYTAGTPDLEARLLAVIQQANADIFERNNQYPERRPMAATVVAALIHENKLFVANVGDSRVYVVWDQDLELLKPETHSASSPTPAEDGTPDRQTPPAPLLPATIKSPPEQPAKPGLPPQPPVRQALGLDQPVKVETFSRRLFPGDIVVLCSGGISGYLTEKEIARAVTRHSPEQALARLIALAAQRGNRDHLAISITRVLSSPVTAGAEGVPLSPPPAPNWSDWEVTSKPEATSPPKPSTPPAGPAKPRSQLSPTPTSPAGRVEPRPQLSPTPTPTAQSWMQRRGRTYALLILALVGFCALAWLAWRYLVPPELTAAVPFLGGAEIEGTAAAGTPAGETAETEAETTGPAEGNNQAASTATLNASGASEDELGAGGNSPLPTPESSFVSPVGPPTASPDQGNSQPAATSAVQLVLPTASPTPIPLPTIELPPNCENKARFVRDVTVDDGEQFAPAEKFEKIWLLENAGDCPWGPGYTVRFIDGDFTGTDSEIPILEVTQPDANGEISVPMIAPAAAGQYRGNWQLFDLAGEPFGPKIYLEIEVTPPNPGQIDQANLTTLYDFIENASQATWSSGAITYTLGESDINESLKLPAPQGLAVIGVAQLRGNVQSEGPVLLTYPHQELGFIEGTYPVDIPLQPTDALAATVGFIKLSILSDDGVTFEVTFTPTAGSAEQVILSRTVQYKDSPVTEIKPLAGIEPGQTGTFTLRVRGGESLSQDWAIWIDLRLIRP